MCFLVYYTSTARAYGSYNSRGIMGHDPHTLLPSRKCPPRHFKTKLLTISPSPTNPTRNTSDRHISTSYLWVAQVHRMHDKQLIFNYDILQKCAQKSLFLQRWHKVLIMLILTCSLGRIFSINNKDKKNVLMRAVSW